MLIAVMSDSHDNIWNLRKAVKATKEANAEVIIHCGDFVAPFMLKELNEGAIPVHAVFGNNDGDQYLLTKMSLTDLSHVTLHGLIGQIELDEGFQIAFTHQEEVADGLARSGRFQMVCFGHSHIFSQKEIGQTVVLNPGEVMGKDGSPGFCLIETRPFAVHRLQID